ncbi:hypothetical protein BX070DRAFT_231088 [Coemansia spiralis]|nr:hypothetical protein BX070DRAFT_231088 [Coemansia spiralis]
MKKTSTADIKIAGANPSTQRQQQNQQKNITTENKLLGTRIKNTAPSIAKQSPQAAPKAKAKAPAEGISIAGKSSPATLVQGKQTRKRKGTDAGIGIVGVSGSHSTEKTEGHTIINKNPPAPAQNKDNGITICGTAPQQSPKQIQISHTNNAKNNQQPKPNAEESLERSPKRHSIFGFQMQQVLQQQRALTQNRLEESNSTPTNTSLTNNINIANTSAGKTSPIGLEIKCSSKKSKATLDDKNR